MLTKKNIFYFIQFFVGTLITFMGMYLIIFPDFYCADFVVRYSKVEYTLLLLYLPTFILHIIAYVFMNACQETGISKRKKNASIVFVILYCIAITTLGLVYLIYKKFPIAYTIYMVFTLLFVGYLLFLTVKTFNKNSSLYNVATRESNI